MAAIDDFREIVTATGGRTRRRKLRQDKGHAAEVEAFLRAVKDGGKPPISWEEIRATTLASILAVRSIREGVPFEILR